MWKGGRPAQARFGPKWDRERKIIFAFAQKKLFALDIFAKQIKMKAMMNYHYLVLLFFLLINVAKHKISPSTLQFE